MDLDPQRGSFHVVLCYAFWAEESLDSWMEQYLQKINQNLEDGAKDSGNHYPFPFLNNAGRTQNPLESYGMGGACLGRRRSRGSMIRRVCFGGSFLHSSWMGRRCLNRE